jgi:hypothetical protein
MLGILSLKSLPGARVLLEIFPMGSNNQLCDCFQGGKPENLYKNLNLSHLRIFL